MEIRVKLTVLIKSLQGSKVNEITEISIRLLLYKKNCNSNQKFRKLIPQLEKL